MRSLCPAALCWSWAASTWSWPLCVWPTACLCWQSIWRCVLSGMCVGWSRTVQAGNIPAAGRQKGWEDAGQGGQSTVGFQAQGDTRGCHIPFPAAVYRSHFPQKRNINHVFAQSKGARSIATCLSILNPARPGKSGFSAFPCQWTTEKRHVLRESLSSITGCWIFSENRNLWVAGAVKVLPCPVGYGVIYNC